MKDRFKTIEIVFNGLPQPAHLVKTMDDKTDDSKDYMKVKKDQCNENKLGQCKSQTPFSSAFRFVLHQILDWTRPVLT